MKLKEIRALYDEHTITVYQAYNNAIASSAVQSQTFVSPPFKKDRMTWIKPSFLWMMYRCGWATKENQEHVLAIKISRSGFEKALENACLSHFDADAHNSYEDWQTMLKASPVRLQWDPEKDIFLDQQSYKSIQVGLSGGMVQLFTDEWIQSIEDITDHCKHIARLITEGQTEQAKALLPQERPYQLPSRIAKIIHANE